MRVAELIQRVWRRCELVDGPTTTIRRFYYRLRGAQIGHGTALPYAVMTWPHQVQIGRNCKLQADIFFNFDHYWVPGPSIVIGDRAFIGRGVEFNIQGRIEVGDDALIASACVFVDHDHGTAPGTKISEQPNSIQPIVVGSRAWIGARSVILKGVTIGEDAVVGAGAVVTKSVPAGEIWAGNPARFLRTRGDFTPCSARDHFN